MALPENVQEQLDLANVTTDTQGYRHVTFQQILNSIPVFEGSIQVHINPAGQVVSFKANRATQVDASLAPTLTAEQAVERAKQEFGEPVSSRVQPQTALLLYKDDADRMYLAWHVQIFSDQDMAIPDNDPTGSSSNIAIAQTGTARDIRLSVDITHTFIGDLRVVLVAPTGQQAVLHDRLGGGQDNLIQTYDTASTPVLTSLVGLAIQGNWTLRVMDLAGRDIGKLNKWSIELTV